jgi:hypothetical protein
MEEYNKLRGARAKERLARLAGNEGKEDSWDARGELIARSEDNV